MSFHVLELLSGLACCVFCSLLAAVCVRAKARALLGRAPGQAPRLSASLDTIAQPAPKSHTQGSRLSLSLASCAALAAFVWIPLGSLPALFPAAWGGLAALGCLALASGFAGNWRWDGATRNKARVLALLALSLALFAWYARQRGMPGELFSLDSYAATPLAGLMEWRGRLGMALLASALLFAVRDVQLDLLSWLAPVTRLEVEEARAAVVSALVRQIWIFAVLGVALCLFAPFCPAGWFGMSGVTGIAADALFFWLKVLLADHAIWLAANKLPQTFVLQPPAQALLAGLGALGIFFA
jgi:hypothetical protein